MFVVKCLLYSLEDFLSIESTQFRLSNGTQPLLDKHIQKSYFPAVHFEGDGNPSDNYVLYERS